MSVTMTAECCKQLGHSVS